MLKRTGSFGPFWGWNERSEVASQFPRCRATQRRTDRAVQRESLPGRHTFDISKSTTGRKSPKLYQTGEYHWVAYSAFVTSMPALRRNTKAPTITTTKHAQIARNGCLPYPMSPSSKQEFNQPIPDRRARSSLRCVTAICFAASE